MIAIAQPMFAGFAASGTGWWHVTMPAMDGGPSDEELIVAFGKSRDYAIFDTVYHRNKDVLLRYLNGKLRGVQKYKNRPLAADIAQETWVKLHNLVIEGRYEVKDARFRTFLCHVVGYSCFVDAMRKWQRENGVIVPLGAPDDEDSASGIENDSHAVAADDPLLEAERDRLMERLHAFLETLPPRQREALLAVDLLGKSLEETAEEMGISAEGVKTNLRHARPRYEEWKAQLRRELEQ